MPQGYTRPNQTQPSGQQAGLGYVPARAPKGGDGSSGSGASGVIIKGGPSGPIISSSRLQVKTVSTTTYTLSPSDLYALLLFTNAAGCTVTVPTDAAAQWNISPLTPVFAFHQSAAGKVTVAGDTGVTVNTLSIYHPRSFGQYAVLQLVQTAANTYTLFGAQDPI